MGEALQPSRAVVIDALLLALSHSKLQKLVSGDLFKSLLNIEYASIVKDGSLELQALWELLSEEPGFDANAAAAPMCVLAGWREQLALEVVLPEHLRALSDREIALRTTECAVPSQEVRRVFEQRRAKRRTSLVQLAVEGLGTPAPLASRKATWRDRREVGWIAGAAAAVAFAFLAVVLIRDCTQDGWEQFEVGEFSAGIPLRSADQIGAQVGAVLEDDGWLASPEAKRRDQMESALRALDARNVRAFFVKDGAGRIRAAAQWYANHTRIEIRFY